MDLDALRMSYHDEQTVLRRVEVQLRDLLDGARKTFKTQNQLIAAPKAPECRIKDFAKLVEKMKRKSSTWNYPSIYFIGDDDKIQVPVGDLVGGRVVCATPEDVGKFSSIVRGRAQQLVDITSETKRLDDGYRALHLNAKMHLFLEDRARWFPVEVQIKTLLQDAWANFGHDEFYKTTEAPPPIAQEISRHLADVLAGLDMIGQAIRDEKLRRKAFAEYNPEETLVTINTLNHLCQQQFGQALSEIELRKCVEQLRAHGYDSIKSVSALVDAREVKALVEASKARVGIKGTPTVFEMLYFCPVAAKAGPAALESEFRRTFSLTDLRCEKCDGVITLDDKSFIVQRTDLDGIFLCRSCVPTRLHKCARCELLTEGDLCKNCRSSDASLEVV